MDKTDFQIKLRDLLRGRFPYIYVVSWEEERVIEEIIGLNESYENIKTPRTIYEWSITEGLIKDPYSSSPEVVVRSDKNQFGLNNKNEIALESLNYIEGVEEPALFIFKDFYVFFGENGSDQHCDPFIIRKIRDMSSRLKHKDSPQNVLFISPSLHLHQDIEKIVSVLDFPLPNQQQITELLDNMIATNKGSKELRFAIDNQGKDRLSKAALGMTLQEAENAFAKTIINQKGLSNDDAKIVINEKSQVIKRSGILEYVNSDISLSTIGGLENLKQWLKKRNNSWLVSAEAYSLPAPKGVLITGVPGCGKSLTAKAMSAMWELPLLRLDMGRIFSGLLGSSEENMRKAINTATAISPCILWIDEIEKGLSGSMGSTLDGGTTQRIFGTFLTWMQEKTEVVFVVATANNIAGLPPEMMRKGRFDEIFFVDLPTRIEREAIFKVHFQKRKKPNEVWSSLDIEKLMPELAEMTEGFVGAEIEQVIVSSLYDAYSENRSLSKQDLLKAVKNTVPLCVTQKEQVTSLRDWANMRAVNASAKEHLSGYKHGTGNDDIVKARGGRTLDV